MKIATFFALMFIATTGLLASVLYIILTGWSNHG